METKFYAPPQALHCLTITTHPGTLTEADVVSNLVRMSLMEEGLSPEEAIEEAKKMPPKELRNVVDAAQWEYNSPEFQDYLTVNKIHPNLSLQLQPIEKEEALARMDEFSLEGFQTWELPTVEWD